MTSVFKANHSQGQAGGVTAVFGCFPCSPETPRAPLSTVDAVLKYHGFLDDDLESPMSLSRTPETTSHLSGTFLQSPPTSSSTIDVVLFDLERSRSQA